MPKRLEQKHLIAYTGQPILSFFSLYESRPCFNEIFPKAKQILLEPCNLQTELGVYHGDICGGHFASNAS